MCNVLSNMYGHNVESGSCIFSFSWQNLLSHEEFADRYGAEWSSLAHLQKFSIYNTLADMEFSGKPSCV